MRYRMVRPVESVNAPSRTYDCASSTPGAAPKTATDVSNVAMVRKGERRQGRRAVSIYTLMVFSLAYIPRRPSIETSPTRRYSPGLVGS